MSVGPVVGQEMEGRMTNGRPPDVAVEQKMEGRAANERSSDVIVGRGRRAGNGRPDGGGKAGREKRERKEIE